MEQENTNGILYKGIHYVRPADRDIQKLLLVLQELAGEGNSGDIIREEQTSYGTVNTKLLDCARKLCEELQDWSEPARQNGFEQARENCVDTTLLLVCAVGRQQEVYEDLDRLYFSNPEVYERCALHSSYFHSPCFYGLTLEMQIYAARFLGILEYLRNECLQQQERDKLEDRIYGIFYAGWDWIGQVLSSKQSMDIGEIAKLLSLDEREERQRLELFGVAFLLAERQKVCIIEGPQLYQIYDSMESAVCGRFEDLPPAGPISIEEEVTLAVFRQEIRQRIGESVSLDRMRSCTDQEVKRISDCIMGLLGTGQAGELLLHDRQAAVSDIERILYLEYTRGAMKTLDIGTCIRDLIILFLIRQIDSTRQEYFRHLER